MYYEQTQSQKESMMLARLRTEYIFRAIDPAIVPEMKDQPGRSAIAVLGAMIGRGLGVF